MALKEVISEHKNNMQKALDYLKDEMKGLRTGRASTGLVENIRVEYYGSPTPLKQLATIATPQANLIMIKPFDPASTKDIEKAIKTSDLSIAPMVEGSMIRLNIPTLSQERRQHLVTQAKDLGEQAKVSIRNIRRDGIKQLEKEEKDSIITEDDRDYGKKQFDDMVRDYTEKVDEVIKRKSEEILEG